MKILSSAMVLMMSVTIIFTPAAITYANSGDTEPSEGPDISCSDEIVDTIKPEDAAGGILERADADNERDHAPAGRREQSDAGYTPEL